MRACPQQDGHGVSGEYYRRLGVGDWRRQHRVDDSDEGADESLNLLGAHWKGRDGGSDAASAKEASQRTPGPAGPAGLRAPHSPRPGPGSLPACSSFRRSCLFLWYQISQSAVSRRLLSALPLFSRLAPEVFPVFNLSHLSPGVQIAHKSAMAESLHICWYQDNGARMMCAETRYVSLSTW